MISMDKQDNKPPRDLEFIELESGNKMSKESYSESIMQLIDEIKAGDKSPFKRFLLVNYYAEYMRSEGTEASSYLADRMQMDCINGKVVNECKVKKCKNGCFESGVWWTLKMLGVPFHSSAPVEPVRDTDTFNKALSIIEASEIEGVPDDIDVDALDKVVEEIYEGRCDAEAEIEREKAEKIYRRCYKEHLLDLKAWYKDEMLFKEYLKLTKEARKRKIERSKEAWK